MIFRLQRKQNGFTLIELLIVIAIIGLLASVVLTSVNTARKSARDAQRVANMRVIRDALASYYQDNGSYPLSTGGTWQGTDCTAGYITGLAPNYITKLPKDPTCGGGTCIGTNGKDFIYNSNGTDYKLLNGGCFETTAYTSSGKIFADPPRIAWGGAYGAVYTPGASAW